MAGVLVADTLQDGAGNSTSMDNAIYGSAKAWVSFNGVPTVSIKASYNVSSITRNGTGDYTVNFTNALTDANYAFAGSGTGVNGSDYPTWLSFICPSGTSTPTTKTSTQARIGNFSGFSSAPGYKDASEVDAIFLR